ncbi:MAG TPA: hypothetical protein DIW31_07845 [Bacteroidales bacterium]|nr:hypothetical protein [Bacteroidales bacterium]
MKTIKYQTFIISAILLISIDRVNSQPTYPLLKGDYLGQLQPNLKPTVFAPGIVSTGMYERDFTVSSDGNEIYYSLFQGDWNTIMMIKRLNGVWQEPVVAPFARDTMFFFAEPALSIDGSKIFFLSTKPRANEKAKPGWSNQNIWMADRKADGSWNSPQPLPENINAFDEFYPSLTSDGTLYFCRTDAKTKISQILRAKLVNGAYQDPIVLPEPINGKGTIFNACIAPDDSYLIGCVSERDSSNMKRVTYMLFFHNQDDTWSKGIDLVNVLNLPCPNAISVSVSFDGKYLFFASTIKTIKFKELQPEWKLNSISQRRLSAGNGNSDIYWLRIEDGFRNLKK